MVHFTRAIPSSTQDRDPAGLWKTLRHTVRRVEECLPQDKWEVGLASPVPAEWQTEWDDQGSTFQFVWPVPEPHDTRRETRSPAARTSQLQCSDAAVGPWLELTCPKTRPYHFHLGRAGGHSSPCSPTCTNSRLTYQPVGSSLEPVHPNTEKEPSRGQQHLNAIQEIAERLSSEALSDRATHDQEQQGPVLVFQEALRRRGGPGWRTR